MERGIFDIRYVKLHFILGITEDTVMPRYKASAIRGGIGEMLLRANCIRDRNCDNCDFESECIVRRTMYSKMEIQPEFMSAGDSVGYVTECEDYREEFSEGDELRFNLLLFGKTIVYFSQYLNAIYALGMNGIGKDHSRYRIISVKNTMNKDILVDNNINMDEYKVGMIADYIAYRRRQAEKEPLKGEIAFRTPLTVKYRGEEIKSFAIEPIYEAAKRRVYMLDCFEGIESNGMEQNPALPAVTGEEHHKVAIRRYSNHQESTMMLHGIQGSLTLEELPDEMLDILFAGELMHIGKNTSFGFGRFRIQ